MLRNWGKPYKQDRDTDDTDQPDQRQYREECESDSQHKFLLRFVFSSFPIKENV